MMIHKIIHRIHRAISGSRNILHSIIIGLIFCSFPSAGQDQPNVVFVFADQMRNHTLAVNQEDPTITPNIDALAAQGVRFRNAISSHPVCTPFRGMLITGKHPLKTGMTRNCSPETPGLWLRSDPTSFGNVFKANGYQTGYIGKWHLDDAQDAIELLGYSPDGNRRWDTYTPPGPKRQGFEFWHAYNAYDQHLSPHYWEDGAEMLEFDIWSPRHEVDVAMEFIESRDPGKPFLIMVSMNPPHPPATQVPEEYQSLYDENDILLNRKNVSLTGEGAAAEGRVRDYFAAVTGVDDHLGRLVDYLKQEGLFENTIIVFSADHGEMMGSHGRMNKSAWYEESINIPLVVSYPERMSPGVSECLVNPMDFLPTLLGLSGLNVPEGYDGEDLSGEFMNPGNSPEDTVFLAGYHGDPFSEPDSTWLMGGWRGLRTKHHSFVARMKSGELTFELYDLAADKWQLRPMSSSDPGEHEEFARFYRSLVHNLKQMRDPFLENRITVVDSDPYNLIVNPDFEFGHMGGWNTWNNSITNLPENVFEGEWAGLVKGGAQGSVQQNLALKSNTPYRASLYAKMKKAGESGAFIINKYGGDKIVIPVEGTAYKNYEVEFTTGIVTEPVVVSFYKHNASYNEGYCDNFRLVETGDIVTDIVFENTGDCNSIAPGNSQQVIAHVLPETALDRTLTWTVTNGTGEATVDEQGNVTGVSEGTVKITATANDGSGISRSLDIIVSSGVGVKALYIQPDIPGNSLQLPESIALSAVFDPAYVCNQSVTWSVNNITGMATISESGVLKTYGAGNIEVIATSNANPDVTAKLELEVLLVERNTYFVNATSGNDSNDGLAENSAWKSLEKVNTTSFNPGDSILFKAGETWSGQLEITTHGAIGHPVVFSRYGDGDDPRIDGNGEKDWTLLLLNSSFTEAENFELTNKGAGMKGGRYGAMMQADNKGAIYNTIFRKLSVHDVNGDVDKSKGGGGGIVWKIGGETPSRFVDAVIEDCHVYDCERNGIVGKSAYTASEYQYKKEYYSLKMQIRRNLVERIPGDGIVVLGCDSAVVEYNICRDFTDALPDLPGNAAAGIWPWNSHNTIIQYNEASGHQASWDAQGFDSDYNCDGTIIQYNYSHDNAGGFILICSNGQWNGYNDNSIVRYNISINDGYRTWGRGADFCPSIHIAGNTFNTKIYNNTIYTKTKPSSVDKQFIEATNWNGLPDVTYIYNNIFYAEEPTGLIMGESTNYDFSNNFYSSDAVVSEDKNAFRGNPMFINPGTSENVENYKLLPESPAIAKGLIIPNSGGIDFFGNEIPVDSKPAIGAHQPGDLNAIFDSAKQPCAEHPMLFPNPLKDTFLFVKLDNIDENAKLSISSLTGELLYMKKLEVDQPRIEKVDISDYRQGMYILSFHTSAGIKSERFIVY